MFSRQDGPWTSEGNRSLRWASGRGIESRGWEMGAERGWLHGKKRARGRWSASHTAGGRRPSPRRAADPGAAVGCPVLGTAALPQDCAGTDPRQPSLTSAGPWQETRSQSREETKELTEELCVKVRAGGRKRWVRGAVTGTQPGDRGRPTEAQAACTEIGHCPPGPGRQGAGDHRPHSPPLIL